MDRVIIHSDANCFYASVEMLYHPELAGKPLAGIFWRIVLMKVRRLHANGASLSVRHYTTCRMTAGAEVDTMILLSLFCMRY